ncbi:bifunctional phosphoribosylaminoimidazolecarboxamide formyltransferase/IMP cyclohydrolase [Halocatena halophila]|uniref:bifunctional phosphoribosylaminoimidazolecarboxamide formyltransferase/IMP cyclohydrolase n=1 Tax=Halocatena halophila TaxID=2814576 RepID=UPI002ED3EF1A
MVQIAGMASNRGRNLRNIADRSPGGAEFSVIFTNDASAPVLSAASERDIPTEVVERDADESRESHERRILDRLSSYDVDLVCLDGYMRVLTETFLEAAPLTLNVHPSLLPSFKGMDAWGDALDAGVRTTGCTVHVVTEAVDEGPIVAQEPVPVYEDDTAADLKDRVLYDGEFVAYPRAVEAIAEGRVSFDGDAVTVTGDDDGALPTRRYTTGDRVASLRYGENPHQEAALYADRSCGEASVVGAEQLNEGAKALSYNNYNDADGALNLIKEFDEPAAAVIKHTNPAGCASAETLTKAYEKALSTDPMSAFGGIVALNRECNEATAEQIIDSFKEVVVAPGYTEPALEILETKSNLRVLDVGEKLERTEQFTEKQIVGGRLVQERDEQLLTIDDLEVVTDRQPTDEQLESMLFAWSVIKHVKSNAIIFADGTETVGIGMGQVSRVDAVRLAGMKATEHAEGKSPDGAVMASDAFFPFPDGVEAAAEHGIEAVIQPGGSKNDDTVIEAANELDMAMVFTGQRAFRHD